MPKLGAGLAGDGASTVAPRAAENWGMGILNSQTRGDFVGAF
jgi:hypothetical protein